MRFNNGSNIKTIKTSINNIRGERSNFITCICYDVQDNEWILKTLDIRKSIDRYIPEWMFYYKEV